MEWIINYVIKLIIIIKIIKKIKKSEKYLIILYFYSIRIFSKYCMIEKIIVSLGYNYDK